MKQPKVEMRPLCPLAGFQECRGERCMIWDDDWQICSLNNGSLYSMVRAAVCDAAVEVMGEYQKSADARGAGYTSSVTFGDSFPSMGSLGSERAVMNA